MRCATPGPCSSQPQGHITAFKFQRIRCTICFTSPDNHQKEKDHTWKTWACLILFHVVLPYVAVKLLQKKRFLTFGTTALSRDAFHWVHKDSRNSGTSQKGENRTAGCCTLLKRITKLKCVNSEVKSVDIRPKQGCLNWPYGTLSESP